MAEFTMRDGSVVEDRRLGRLVQEDPRSLSEYHIRGALRSALAPRGFTWAAGPVTDQGEEGACVGHGWTGELTARPRPVVISSTSADDYAYQLYKRCQVIDQWPGENYDGTSVLAGAQELKARGLIQEYRWASSLEDLVLAVGYKGPAVLGIAWYRSMYRPMSGRVIVSGDVVGGHCILARGVSVRNRTFTLRNSWGPEWGNGGDAVISWDDMARLLSEDGEACIPVLRTAKASA